MLNPRTPVNDNFRRDLDLADPTLLDPTNANALEAGEWLALNANGKAVRVGTSSIHRAYQVFTPKGDFSGQAIGKTSVLQLHAYEAETDIFVDAGGGFTIDQYLTVKEITVDSVTRAGLTQAVQGTDHAYAVVRGLPANNNGMLVYEVLSSPFDWTT